MHNVQSLLIIHTQTNLQFKSYSGSRPHHHIWVLLFTEFVVCPPTTNLVLEHMRYRLHVV